ncbi:hypothetical protein ACFWBR_28345, partial [Streptomyces sp. NPDC060006]|uniref:hypothetical protein n=1 Tax=unclassified Streptomyces TaxID=2593676 RepID=UPI0036CC7295
PADCWDGHSLFRDLFRPPQKAIMLGRWNAGTDADQRKRGRPGTGDWDGSVDHHLAPPMSGPFSSSLGTILFGAALLE